MQKSSKQGPPGRAPFDRALWAVILAAFALRLVYVLAAPLPPTPNGPDAPLYDELAMRLITEGKYCANDNLGRISQAYRPVLFPFVLGGIYKMCGHHVTAPRVFHCVLGALTCGLVYSMGRELFGRRAAILAGIGAAIFPQLIYYTGTLTTETLHTFMLTSAMYLLVLAYRREAAGAAAGTQTPPGRDGRAIETTRQARPRYETPLVLWAAAGACLGLAALARSAALALVPVVGLWLLIVLKNKPQAITRALVVAAAAAVAMSPWWIRNCTALGAFVPATTDGGYTFWVTNNPRATGSGACFLPDDVSPFRGLTELQADRLYYKMGIGWARSHPGDFARLLGAKFVRLWRPWPHAEEAGIGWGNAAVAGVSFVPVLLLAIWGAVITWQRRHGVLLFYLVIGCTTVLYCLYMGVTRYRAPLMPMLLVLAGVAAERLIFRRSRAA